MQWKTRYRNTHGSRIYHRENGEFKRCKKKKVMKIGNTFHKELTEKCVQS